MRGQSVVRELYQGNLRPCDLQMEKNEDYALYMQDISRYGAWLEEHLEGKAKTTLLNLLNAHSELDGLVSYENFRRGFVLGAKIIMEICMSPEEEGDD